MTYYLNLFSPETYEVFSASNRTISGFRETQISWANRICPGDKFICYMTKLSRWVGVLEVSGDWYEDHTPFYEENDPFVIRFPIRPVVWLDKDHAIPIREDYIWEKLSFTRDRNRTGFQWTGKLRSSLSTLDDEDGYFLEQELLTQSLPDARLFPVDTVEYERLTKHRVRRPDKVVSVSVPQDTDHEMQIESSSEVRESIKMQAVLAEIGVRMGMSLWIPRNDRGRVLAELSSERDWPILDSLPLSYDPTTLDTIRQIDILWLKGRAIKRAFEVEHTTSIYSGILRMADLLALQPNMEIKLHIVAPASRKEKVMQELQRPVFSLLEKGPLYESCTYLSYDAVREISHLKHLNRMSDDVLDDYDESANEAEV